jgi:hypothetical protein
MSFKDSYNHIVNIGLTNYLESNNSDRFGYKLWKPEKVEFLNGRTVYPTGGLLSGFHVQKLDEDDYYGIVISRLSEDTDKNDQDQLYLLEDFTVVHNTAGAVGATIDVLLTYPGAQAICGSKTYQDLKDTVLEEYRKRFTVNKPWDHPLVEAKPTDHSKILRLTNGSFARFMHFEDFERLRGREADIVHLDEASQLDDARPYQELLRRLSGSRVPTRQFFLTTNPPEVDNWLHQEFVLKQFAPGYKGPEIPIGDQCTCQYCQICINEIHEEIEWDWITDKDNPEITVGVCPNCGILKQNDCDGAQNFLRVILSSAKDNPAIPSDWIQNQKATQDAATFALYTEGKLIQLREGKVFKSYGRANVLPFNKDVDLDKSLHWTFDFNISYQCSAIIQTTNTVQGIVGDVLDEFILPESGPEEVAREFMRRYQQFSRLNNPKAQSVILYGDPAGLNRSSAGNERSKFQIIYDILTSEGYEVDMAVRKIKGNTQIPLLHSVDATNMMLCNADGLRRLFFNPKCEWYLISMEGTKYKGDNPAIDKQCDENAARNPEKIKPKMLTHPSDSIRYWVVKVDPILKNNGREPYVHIPGEGVIKVTARGAIVQTEPPEDRTVRDDLSDLLYFGNLFHNW